MATSTSMATSFLLVLVLQPLLAVQPHGVAPSWRPNPAVMEHHRLGNLVEEVRVEEELEVLWPDNAKSVEEMVGEAGYPVESHVVATTDGYLLTLHRIPHGRSGPQEASSTTRPAVFLQHGLLSSSADWVVTGPEHALAFLLADRGYDVWMGNYRGNLYSLGHLSPRPDPAIFWDFSWDEMAERDLPAMLAHMMQVTGEQQFHFIGHSMGTLTYFTACNYHPWIANATKLMVGYGSHTRVPNMTSPLFKWMARWLPEMRWLLRVVGVHQFMPANWLMDWIASEVCDEHMASQKVCRNMLFLIAGYNQAEMNNTMLPVIMGHTPAGTSTLTMIHYGQSVRTAAWSGLDRGSPSANLARWNSTSPPDYMYSPITAPVALFWGANDWLVVPQDEEDLAAKIPHLVTNTRVAEANYTHLDFLWGMNNLKLVYGPTLDIMASY